MNSSGRRNAGKVLLGVRLAVLCAAVSLAGCSTGKRTRLETERGPAFPQGYLSSFYDAFHGMYLADGLQSPRGYDALVNSYPDSAEAHLLRADAYVKYGDYSEARRSIDRCISLDATNALAYAKRAEIKQLQRMPLDSVLGDERRCVELDSTNASYAQQLLFHLHDAGKYDECIAYALRHYAGHEEDGVADVVLSSCYLSKGDRKLAKDYIEKFATRENAMPWLNGFALMAAAVLNEGSLIELFYTREKRGGCVSARDMAIYQSYLKHSGKFGDAFKEGVAMVSECEYDASDIERLLQSISPIGILDSVSMAEGLAYADVLLKRYPRVDAVLGFAEIMYRKVKDNTRTYELLRRVAERDSGDFLRWAILQEFEDFHANVDGEWVDRTKEDWKNAAQAYPLSRWNELSATQRYIMKRFPNALVATQYLAKLYDVTKSFEAARDTAYHYIDYYTGCMKHAGKQDTVYYHGASWEQKLPAQRAYRKTISALHAFVGDLYMSRDMREQAYKEYQKGLKFEYDNTILLNNYAYYLAKDTKANRLKEAERMSKRCIELEPKNATYLDTYAYILYLRGEYQKAKGYYAELFSLGEVQSAEVYRNYSALLEAMGSKTSAEVYRMKAAALEQKQR